jgi:hypothetical protein
MTAQRPPDLTAAAARSWHRPVVLVPALLLLSLAGGAFPSFSVAANLYVLAVGGALAWLGLSERVPKRRNPGRLPGAAAWWLVPTLGAALLELTDFLLGSTTPHPTMSGLMDPVLAGYLPRSAAYCIWLFGMWGLVRR